MSAELGPVAINQIRQLWRESYLSSPLVLPAYENVGRMGLQIKLGKTDAALNKGTFASPNSGTVSVWNGTTAFASLADSTENITAFNFWGNIGSGKQVLCLRTLMGWVAIAAEC